jgi:hypothetical protein
MLFDLWLLMIEAGGSAADDAIIVDSGGVGELVLA